MGHGHTCLSADRLECDLDLRVLIGPEGGLTPAEDEPFARLPDPDAANLEDSAVRQRLGEASTLMRLEGERAGRTRCELKQRVRRPPQCDVARKYLEGAPRRGRHAHRYQNSRRHDARST